MQRQQEQLDSISQQRASDEQRPEVDVVPDQRRSSVGSTQLEASAALEQPAAHYPVDDLMEKTNCELHMLMH